uniref:Uncharacterized protein n=1 Tax=Plectus sambesii TaxID=2011161 RepID=A0A914USA3_9BILA
MRLHLRSEETDENDRLHLERGNCFVSNRFHGERGMELERERTGRAGRQRDASRMHTRAVIDRTRPTRERWRRGAGDCRPTRRAEGLGRADGVGLVFALHVAGRRRAQGCSQRADSTTRVRTSQARLIANVDVARILPPKRSLSTAPSSPSSPSSPPSSHDLTRSELVSIVRPP